MSARFSADYHRHMEATRHPAALSMLAGVIDWACVALYPIILFAVLQPIRPVAVPLVLLPVLVVPITRAVRRRPMVALPLLSAGTLAVTLTSRLPASTGVLVLSLALAAGFVVATRRPMVAVPFAVAALLVQLAADFAYVHGNDAIDNAAALIVLANVVAWMVAVAVRQRRTYAAALRAQEAAAAVAAERLRIARELHDIVAHSIGIIAIQAGVGARVIDTQPAEARNALSAIELTSRETLAGLRRMLGTLRRAEAEAVSLDPPPGLADLAQLISAAGLAGVRVEISSHGEVRPLPATVDLSAYRIVQEAVTNVIRHAGTGTCRVTLDFAADEVGIEVLDDGVGAAVPGIGYGLVGMRERVALLDGRFTAGPRPEGGFRVLARLPLSVALATR